MSDDFEFDPSEYAEQLGYTEELGRGDLSKPKRNEEASQGLSRQELLVRGGLGAAAVMGLGAGLGTAAGPAAAEVSSTGKFTGTLRVLTLGVEFPTPDIAEQASKDLGFTVKPILAPSEKQPQIAITSPDTFDVFGGYNYQTLLVWPSGSLQPVDTRRIPSWKQFYKLFTDGKLNPASKRCTYGDGNAPFRTTFVDPDGSTGLPAFDGGPRNNKEIVRWIGENGKPIQGKPQPRWIVGPAAHFNADSMGYNADVIKKRPSQVSWAELLNAQWKGRVALLRDPGIMTQDAAIAASALGLMKFKDFGNPTKAEIDRLVKIMTKYKKQGQFRAFWSTFTESVNLMVSKEVVLESMWSPAVALVKAAGVNILYAAPPEGFRGWCSTRGHLVEGHRPGEAAGLLRLHQLDTTTGTSARRSCARATTSPTGRSSLPWIKSSAGQGRPAFSAAEYDFWWGGKAAAEDLPGITGKVGDVKKGERRDGGSFAAAHLQVLRSWNSYFTENVYQIKTVNDFLSPRSGYRMADGGRSSHERGGGTRRPLRPRTGQGSISSA